MATKQIKRKNKTKSRSIPMKGLAGRVAEVEAALAKTALPDFRPGDTIRVQVRIVEGDKERLQAFEGVCLRRTNRGANKSFTVRKMSYGTGVERQFIESSPKIGGVELVQSGKVRRSKLYYLRELQGRAARVDRDMDADEAAASKS